MNRVFSETLSAWWPLPSNDMSFFKIESWYSMLITMILMLTVLFSRWARMVSMVAVDSSYLEFQASLTLLVLASISTCNIAISTTCLPNRSSLMSWIHTLYHFLSPVTSIMRRSLCLAAVMIVSLSGESSMLVVVIPSSPIRLLFSLYISRWSRMCEETFLAAKFWFPISTMFMLPFILLTLSPYSVGRESSCRLQWGSWWMLGILLQLFFPELSLAQL